MNAELLRFSTVGSVDDGKSTLIGRLLYDLESVSDDQIEATRRASKNGLDLSLFTDGLRAEREQGITIDVAYRHFRTLRRHFILADTPGHEQYTPNMVTGASTADVVVLLVDVCNGVLHQTKRHAYLAWLLGIRRFCVVINKMDKVGFGHAEFKAVRSAFQKATETLHGCQFKFIPISALEGDNVVHMSSRMPWYAGETLLDFLNTVPIDDSPANSPLRLPVQYVIRGSDGARLYAGQLATGRLTPGTSVLALPSRRTVRVQSIVSYHGDLEEAAAPMSVALRLTDPVDLGRGHMIADPLHPPLETTSIEATLFWMSQSSLKIGHTYLLRHTTQEVRCEVTKLKSALDVGALQYGEGMELVSNGIGRALLTTRTPIFCDAYSLNRATGSFILIDDVSHETVAAGIIDHAQVETLFPARAMIPTSHGLVVWFTGPPSAGKTTLSQRVCKRLLAYGLKAEVLDGDLLRDHLSRELGFSREDREENIRRIAFVARLLARNGVVVLVSAIAPYRSLRDEVRKQVSSFVEVYVNAPLSVCEERDVKGLYRRAREGQLKQLTGLDDPYEAPTNPEVECRTDSETVEQSTLKVIQYLEGHFLQTDRLAGS